MEEGATLAGGGAPACVCPYRLPSTVPDPIRPTVCIRRRTTSNGYVAARSIQEEKGRINQIFKVRGVIMTAAFPPLVPPLVEVEPGRDIKPLAITTHPPDCAMRPANAPHASFSNVVGSVPRIRKICSQQQKAKR